MDVISEHRQSLAGGSFGITNSSSSASDSTDGGGMGGPVVALVELSYGDGIDAASSKGSSNNDKESVSVRELVESFCADLMSCSDGSSPPLVRDVLVSQNESQMKVSISCYEPINTSKRTTSSKRFVLINHGPCP
jgi:hypothetical protein